MKPISIRELAKWYGDVTGLNGVSFDLLPGITGPVSYTHLTLPTTPYV